MSQYSWFTVYLGHPAVHTFIQNLGPMLCTDLMCDFIHGDYSFKKLAVFWSYYLMERGNWHGTTDLPCTMFLKFFTNDKMAEHCPPINNNR